MINFETFNSHPSGYILNKIDENLVAPPHFHSSYEFVYVYSGEMLLHIGNRTFVLKEKQGCLILPSEVHWYDNVSYSKSFISIFSADYISDIHKLLHDRELVNPVFKFTQEVFLNEFASSKDDYIIKSFYYYLFSHAMRGGFRNISTSLDTALTYNIQNYIYNNFKGEISLKKMAQDLNYNYTYLSNFFNKNFKTSFSKLINEYRIDYAKKLIETKSISITEISIEVGFLSIRNFNRVFIEFVKMTPKEYRKLCKST